MNIGTGRLEPIKRNVKLCVKEILSLTDLLYSFFQWYSFTIVWDFLKCKLPWVIHLSRII